MTLTASPRRHVGRNVCSKSQAILLLKYDGAIRERPIPCLAVVDEQANAEEGRIRTYTNAFMDLRLDRFDLQYTFKDIHLLHAEEVYIYSNIGPDPQPIAVLSERERALQLNLKVTNAEGRNLICMSRSEISELLHPVHMRAAAHFRNHPRLPPMLKEIVEGDAWQDEGKLKAWAGTHAGNTEELAEFAVELEATEEEGDAGAMREIVGFAFLDFLLNRISDYYRPVVVLPAQLDKCGDGEPVPPKVFIKYAVDIPAPYPYPTKFARIRAAIRGSDRIEVEFPVSVTSSTHLRLRPPEGGILRGPMVFPVEPERVVQHHQAQFYLPAPREGEGEILTSRVEFTTYFTQKPSMRLVTALLFAAVAFLPFLLMEVDLLYPPDPAKPLAEVTFRPGLDDLADTMRLVRFNYVEKALAVAVPLAVGLFASAWNQAYARPFMVTQLAWAVIFTVWWGLTPLTPLAGVAALVGAGIFAVWNAVDCARGLSPIKDGIS